MSFVLPQLMLRCHQQSQTGTLAYSTFPRFSRAYVQTTPDLLRAQLVIIVRNGYVHSNESASHHLSTRGMLVFGMCISIFQYQNPKTVLALLPPKYFVVCLFPAATGLLIPGFS